MPTGRLPACKGGGGRLALAGGRIGDGVPHALGLVRVREPPGNDAVEIHTPGRGEERAPVLLEGEDLEQRSRVPWEQAAKHRPASGQRERPEIAVEPGKVERGECEESFARSGGTEGRAVPVERYYQTVEHRLDALRGSSRQARLQLGQTGDKLAVTRVDPARSSVTIAHEPVESLKWPAMTMGFKVEDKAMLEKLKPGEKVDFSFRKSGKDYVLTEVK